MAPPEFVAAITQALPDDPESRVDPPPPAAVTVVHHWALIILATIAVVFALDWAQSFFISLLLGILFTYTLNPLVACCERIGMPRTLAAGIVMLGVVLALIFGTYSLRGQVQTILDQVPAAVSKLSAGLADLRHGQAATMQRMESAAREIEQATNQAGGSAGARPATRVVIEPPRFKLGNFIWAGSRGAAEILGQTATVLFLTLFLLISGDTYKRKLVRLTGPALSSRKITVRMLDEINASIQKYLLMLLATNVLVGLLSWLALSWIGLENAGAWAAAAGLLHLVPYFGTLAVAAAVGMAAYMQFDALAPALLAAGVFLAIATLVGTLITTWVAGRFSRMHSAAVFVSLLFWGWLWGVWGMLLSVPIMVIVKAVAQHVAPQGAIAVLLGD